MLGTQSILKRLRRRARTSSSFSKSRPLKLQTEEAHLSTEEAPTVAEVVGEGGRWPAGTADENGGRREGAAAAAAAFAACSVPRRSSKKMNGLS